MSCARSSWTRRCRRPSTWASRSPIPALAWNEATKHWDIGPIDWDEFWRVVKGEGPCNRQRLAAKRAAHEDGAWVREAAEAFAAKRAARTGHSDCRRITTSRRST